jgi:hypothetical protein
MDFEVALSAGEEIGEPQLASLLHLEFNLAPSHMGISQVGWVITFAFMALFGVLGLGVEFRDPVLDHRWIIQNQESIAWEVIQDGCLTVEIGQIEGDILKGAALAKLIQVMLPAFLGIAVQNIAI